DVNCDGSVNEGDVLSLLLFAGGVSTAQPASESCPPIGDPLDGLATTTTTPAH
ncbi:MAG: hypothetical protein JRE70_19445, partial [Deltaproteobacteria bacterium]|nr:hypothetical protein [Deltaproteobacteria bacterium]